MKGFAQFGRAGEPWYSRTGFVAIQEQRARAGSSSSPYRFIFL